LQGENQLFQNFTKTAVTNLDRAPQTGIVTFEHNVA